jgi:dihydroorotate dehydrogenase electron transfer subunit
MPAFTAKVLANRHLPPDGAVVTVEVPRDLPLDAFQFAMLSMPQHENFPFLPRPFSVYDARQAEWDFLVKKVGTGTTALADAKVGDSIFVAGPVGIGITALPADRRAIAVAGGVGIAPFLLLYRRWLEGRVTLGAQKPLLLFGGRTRDMLYDLERFTELPIEVRCSTDDGSFGVKGRVTVLLEQALAEGPADVLCCGPDPMMEAVAAVCAKHATPCRLSLETFMACGYGVCNACAVPVKDARYPRGFRYDRCCVDGPVFDASTLVHAH